LRRAGRSLDVHACEREPGLILAAAKERKLVSRPFSFERGRGRSVNADQLGRASFYDRRRESYPRLRAGRNPGGRENHQAKDEFETARTGATDSH
jgi:hypothetical protein